MMGTILQQMSGSLVLKIAPLVNLDDIASCLASPCFEISRLKATAFLKQRVGTQGRKLVSNPAPQDSQNVLLKQGIWDFCASHHHLYTNKYNEMEKL